MSDENNCDLIIVCPHMGDGGSQKVISLLANAWAEKGLRITLITLYEHQDAYQLREEIKRVDISHLRGGRRFGENLIFIFGRILKAVTELSEYRIIKVLIFPLQAIIYLFKIIISLLKIVIIGFRISIGFVIAGIKHFLNSLDTNIGIVYFINVMLNKFIGIPRSPARYLNRRIGPYLHLISVSLILRSIIKSQDAPIILSFLGSTNILTILACVGLHKKTIISERNDPDLQNLNFPYENLRPKVYKYANLITANSYNAIRSLKRYVPEHKLLYVPNPVVLLNSPDDNSRIDSAPFILCVGRLSEQKAYDIVLKSFKLFNEKIGGLRLKILGQGELHEELQEISRNLGIDKLVDWEGHVSDPARYYESAEIFLQASRHEGMSNSLMEAMSYGLPVITSDSCKGNLEIVRHMETGFVVPAEDIERFASAIEILWRDVNLKKTLGMNAKQTVSKFDLKKVIKIWENVLELNSSL